MALILRKFRNNSSTRGAQRRGDLGALRLLHCVRNDETMITQLCYRGWLHYPIDAHTSTRAILSQKIVLQILNLAKRPNADNFFHVYRTIDPQPADVLLHGPVVARA